VPTPFFALEVQRGGMPGQPGGIFGLGLFMLLRVMDFQF
jgi:hypothetical protein